MKFTKINVCRADTNCFAISRRFFHTGAYTFIRYRNYSFERYTVSWAFFRMQFSPIMQIRIIVHWARFRFLQIDSYTTVKLHELCQITLNSCGKIIQSISSECLASTPLLMLNLKIKILDGKFAIWRFLLNCYLRFHRHLNQIKISSLLN